MFVVVVSSHELYANNNKTQKIRYLATMALRTILRKRLPEFDTFGVQRLVTQVFSEDVCYLYSHLWECVQLQDPWPEVQKAAIFILQEAVNDRQNLVALAKCSPPLHALSDALVTRCVCVCVCVRM